MSTAVYGYVTLVVGAIVAVAVAYIQNRRTGPSDVAAGAGEAAANYTAISTRLAAVEKRLDDKDEELGLVRGRLSTAIHLIRRLLEGDEVRKDEIPAWVMEE